MLSTVVLSNENQTCRGWEAYTSTGGGGCHLKKCSNLQSRRGKKSLTCNFFLSGFSQGTNFGTLSGILFFSGKIKELEYLLKVFKLLKYRG